MRGGIGEEVGKGGAEYRHRAARGGSRRDHSLRTLCNSRRVSGMAARWYLVVDVDTCGVLDVGVICSVDTETASELVADRRVS